MSLTTLSKSEEKLKWRQDGMVNNNGEASSPILSRRGDFQATTQKIGPRRNYYYTLAKESPARVYEDSDTSTYDNSFHCRETDVCRDSTDSDASSYTADAIATVELLEYEVASTSNNEELFSNDSSSGTDEHNFIIAAVTARALCDTSSCTSDFADSEESDSSKSYDSELTAADYWKCIRCKNTQNNPMFRMCEKCYKTRRTHFPPRPRFRKKRSNRNRKSQETTNTTRNCILSSSSSSEPIINYPSNSVELSQEDEVAKRLGNSIPKNNLKTTYQKDYNNGYKKRKISFANNNTSQLNSAAESSGEEWRDLDIIKNSPTSKIKRKSPQRKRDNFSTNQSSSGHSSFSTNIFSNNLDTSLSRKRKASFNDDDIQHLKQSRINITNNPNSNIHTDSESDVPCTSAPESQKDSGISSTHSSQEPVSSSLSDERSTEKDEYLEQCSQETVCGDFDEKDLLELQDCKVETPTELDPTPIKCHLSEIVTNSDHSSSSIMRSVSDISNTILTDIQASALKDTFNLSLNGKDRNIMDGSLSDSSGSCVICLSEPKNGVFVHSTILHLCSCYKCAVKIWHKYKRCPICNSSVKNVMKLFVH